MRPGALALLALLAAPPAQAREPTNWREIISQRDHARLKDWRTTWVEALDQARAAGFGASIGAEGVLLHPDAALDGPDLPDGAYRCRTVKLGLASDQAPGARAFAPSPPGQCRVADGTLLRLDGSQRPGGRLHDYDGARLLFLGNMAVGDEPGATRYPRDAQRALAGLVERIGPARWRLVLPHPAWESRLEVMELVPAG